MSERGWLFPVLLKAMLSVCAEQKAHRVPKSRNAFIMQLAAEATRWGYSSAEAYKLAPSLMRDLEEACAPWGDPDFDWTVGGAREWAAEMLASDEVAA